jgi:hypothetical protein
MSLDGYVAKQDNTIGRLVCREFTNSEAPSAGNPSAEGPGGGSGVLEFGN